MNTLKKLSNAQRILLTACYHRSEALAELDPPDPYDELAYADWMDQCKLGPIYSCSAWYGRVTPAERMKYYRALRALEQSEYVEATRYQPIRSRMIVHLKLTTAGKSLAREIINESKAGAV